jgi:hypothetical protein
MLSSQSWADAIDDCLLQASKIDMGTWNYTGHWDDYGTIHTVAGQTTMTEPAPGKFKVVGTNIVTNQSFQNEMTVADRRTTVTYHGTGRWESDWESDFDELSRKRGSLLKVTSTNCLVNEGRYFLTQRFKFKTKTRMGDDFEFEAKSTGTSEWNLFVNQWRQAGTDNPFTPFLTRWSSKAN